MSTTQNTTESTAPATTYEPEGLKSWQIALDYQDGRSIGSYNTLLVLDLETGRIGLDTDPCRGWYDAGTPERRWHGREQTWTLRPTTDAEALEEALSDPASPIRQALERVYQGGEVRWNGSNFCGYLDDDAQDASYALEQRLLEALPDTAYNAWEASEWLGGEAPDGVDAATTDDELRALLPDLEATAASNNQVLWGSLLEALQEIRDDLKENTIW